MHESPAPIDSVIQSGRGRPHSPMLSRSSGNNSVLAAENGEEPVRRCSTANIGYACVGPAAGMAERYGFTFNKFKLRSDGFGRSGSKAFFCSAVSSCSTWATSAKMMLDDLAMVSNRTV